jgi:putative endonuclease
MGWLQQLRIDCEERAFAGLGWLGQHTSGARNQPGHLVTGQQGELAAFFYLRRKGYVVVARRWSSAHQRGDIDLIAWQGPMLCFVEVKTRTAHDMTAAEVAVDDTKRRVVRSLARLYLRQLPMKTFPPVRFDILSVYLIPGKKKEFVHFEGAFGWSDREYDDWR